LGLQLQLQSMMHFNLKSSVQCFTFNQRMESVLPVPSNYSLRNALLAGGVSNLGRTLTLHIQRAFDDSTKITRPLAGPNDPISWLLDTTGSLMWGVATTFQSFFPSEAPPRAAQGTQLAASDVREGHFETHRDERRVRDVICGPSFTILVVHLRTLLLDHCMCACALIAQCFFTGSDQMPLQMFMNPQQYLSLLHRALQNSSSTDGDGESNGHGEPSKDAQEELDDERLTINSCLRRLESVCVDFGFLSMTVERFQSRLRCASQGEFQLREHCTKCMCVMEKHLVYEVRCSRLNDERGTSSAQNLQTALNHFDVPHGLRFTVESLLKWLARAALCAGLLDVAVFVGLLLRDAELLQTALTTFVMQSAAPRYDAAMEAIVQRHTTTCTTKLVRTVASKALEVEDIAEEKLGDNWAPWQQIFAERVDIALQGLAERPTLLVRDLIQAVCVIMDKPLTS
jgi:hypothetical protein